MLTVKAHWEVEHSKELVENENSAVNVKCDNIGIQVIDVNDTPRNQLRQQIR